MKWFGKKGSEEPRCKHHWHREVRALTNKDCYRGSQEDWVVDECCKCKNEVMLWKRDKGW